MDNKPTFKHDFKTAFGVIDINGIQGYQKALNNVSRHIIDKAIKKDNTLYVNAIELNEVISNTFYELAELLKEEFKGDNLFNNICNIVKQDAKDRLGIDLNKKDFERGGMSGDNKGDDY